MKQSFVGVLAFFCFAVAAAPLVLWIRVFEASPRLSQAEKVKAFSSIFPRPLRNLQVFDALELSIIVLAIILSAVALKAPSGISRALGMFALAGSLVLLAFNLFQYM